MSLRVGDAAPDFTLVDQHGSDFQLADLRGRKSVLLVFYPFAFSGICTGEITALRDNLGDFETDQTTVVAISCDPMFALRAFADRDGIFFPLLSDFWPHGEVSQAYGAFSAAQGCSTRSSFVVGRDGIIRWQLQTEMGVARDYLLQADQLRQSV